MIHHYASGTTFSLCVFLVCFSGQDVKLVQFALIPYHFICLCVCFSGQNVKLGLVDLIPYPLCLCDCFSGQDVN